MNSKNLDSLVKIGQIKKEPFDGTEYTGLVNSGRARLKDAHALALVALRKCGYRANNRYIVFQALPHTTGLGPEVWRILSKCHDQRNLAEYEGHLEVDEQLLNELISSCQTLLNHMLK
ncbi:MAG: hypothetical protein AB7D28_09160 [Candidatus Berkiella sp.]